MTTQKTTFAGKTITVKNGLVRKDVIVRMLDSNSLIALVQEMSFFDDGMGHSDRGVIMSCSRLADMIRNSRCFQCSYAVGNAGPVVHIHSSFASFTCFAA